MRNKTIRVLNLVGNLPKIYSRKQNLQISFFVYQQQSSSLLCVQLVNDSTSVKDYLCPFFLIPNCIKKSRSRVGVEC